MITNKYVEEYRDLYNNGTIKLNQERKDLFDYLDRSVLSNDELYFDEEQIEKYIAFAEKWYFPLEPFQKFIAAFVFLRHKENDRLFYRRYLIMMGRGGGKNGFISTLIHYFTSELHGVPGYNVSLVANSEEQAKVSFEEVYNTTKASDLLQSFWRLTKLKITGTAMNAFIKFRTSNASTKDGLRDGCVIYDEIHQYQTNEVVRVFSSGLGKVKDPREFFIGTDGYVREGYLDRMKDLAAQVLSGEARPDAMFPFLCKLDDAKQVQDPDLWELANPMFSHPRGDYADNLFYTVKDEFQDLDDDPSGREEFMTKRMNLPEEDLEKSVASWEEILATNQDIDEEELLGRTCIGGLDYANIKDFASVGLLFKVGEKYIWKSHSFIRQEFLDRVNMKVPIYEWQSRGDVTIVTGPTIEIAEIIDWFTEMREKYHIETIVADMFRLDLVKTALEDAGFHFLYIRNPRAVHSLLAPRIEMLFAKENLIYGDSPIMRWFTNNVLVKIKPDGNKEYLKKDELRRKTDGFQAFVHALWQADNILGTEASDFYVADINF